MSLDWPTGWSDIWRNIVLIYLSRCFCMRLMSELVDWVKHIALPNMGGPHLIKDLNRTKKLSKEITPPAWLLVAETSIFSSLQTHTETWAFLGSWGYQLLNQNLHSWLSWFSGLWTQTSTTPSALPSLYLADYRFCNFSASITTWQIHYNSSCIYIFF